MIQLSLQERISERIVVLFPQFQGIALVFSGAVSAALKQIVDFPKHGHIPVPQVVEDFVEGIL